MPTDLLSKNNLYFSRIWDSQREGKVAEEFYDVILEVAAYAKKHLEIGRSYIGKLPKNAHRALLLSVEADIYLTELEKVNFNIFDSQFTKKSFFQTPYKINKAAKAERF